MAQIHKHHHAWQHKLENVEIDKVWIKRIGMVHFFYQFHIKSAHNPDHNHLTVLVEEIDKKFKVWDIQEGHKILF